MAKFEKGKTPEGAKPISEEVAKEYQLKSAAKRKQNRTIAETLRKALNEKIESGSRMTKMEWLVLKAMQNAQGNVSFRDLKDIQALLGESVQNVNVTGDPKVVEMTQEAISALGKWSGKKGE